MSKFAIQMRKISKTYGAVKANDLIDFEVTKGTIHALAGENGAGKSTLMKILFGLEQPDPVDGAEIQVAGQKVNFRTPIDAIKKGLGMVQQHFALAGPLAAVDNIILGAENEKSRWPARWLVDRESAIDKLQNLPQHLWVRWAATTEDLPVGEQQRLEILKLLFRDAEILILDEPTAVLTPQEVEKFFELLKDLKGQGRTVIVITHKLHEILDHCDEVTVLRHGKPTGRFSTAGLTKEALVRAMVGRDLKQTKKKPAKLGDDLLSAKGVQTKAHASGNLRGLDLRVRSGEVVGIAGVEGNGQQSLVESLLGLIAYDGEIHVAKPLGLISEDRHRQSLWLEGSIQDNVVIGLTEKVSKHKILNPKTVSAFAQKTLQPYSVKYGNLSDDVKTLSGGNQQKIVVAREISGKNPKVLIASQPTRGVDVGAIEFIHEQVLNLRDVGAGVLLISSELEELTSLSDRILVLFEGRIAAEFTGPDYDISRLGLAMTGGAT